MGADGRRFTPGARAEQSSEPEVHDPQPAIVTEHELRRGQLAVHQVAAVGVVERPTGVEADDERLGGVEQAAPVEQIAKAATAEVLDRGEHRDPAADAVLAPVVHGGDVHVRQRRHRAHHLVEATLELGQLGDLRPDELQRDGSFQLDVGGVHHDRAGARCCGAFDPISVGDHDADQGGSEAGWCGRRRAWTGAVVVECHSGVTLSGALAAVAETRSHAMMGP
ncbi:MAG: hypothetical protein WKF58_03950 [Ilumatobacteraceae bacterium]